MGTCGTCSFASGPDATAVFACLTCPNARGGATVGFGHLRWGARKSKVSPDAFVACSLNGRPLVARACGGKLVAHAAMVQWDGKPGVTGCPLGKAPDAKGRARWLGMLWRGVPWIKARMLEEEAMAEFWFGLPGTASSVDLAATGCGCVDRWKSLVERIAAWFGHDPPAEAVDPGHPRS